MAKSFWSKRNESTNISGDYSAPKKQSRLGSILTTILGILLVGGLLFAVFWGARWTFSKLTDEPTSAPVVTAPSEDGDNTTVVTDENTHDAGEVTVTSSTSTTTPSTTTSTTSTTSTSSIPNTGATSNITIFLAISLVAYLGHRLVASRR